MRPTHVIAFFAMATALLWPAVWNGAPLFYYDSVDYLVMPFTYKLPVFRTAPYGWFQCLVRIGGSPWSPVIAQALMVAGIVWLSVRALMPGLGPLAIAGGVVLLAAATGWAWYVSQVMADAVTGAVILGVVALACGERLPRFGRIALVLMLALCIAFHVSHLVVAAGLLACIGIARLAGRWVRSVPRLAARDLALAIAGSMLISLWANYAATGRAFLLQDASNLRLALFVEAGLVKPYLDRECAKNERAFLLCRHRNALPKTANAYLWNTFGPFHDLGGWKSEEHRREAARIVAGIATTYPGETLARLSGLAARQFAMVETGDGIRPMYWHLEKPIKRYYSDFLDDFHEARQQGHIEFRGYALRDGLFYWGALVTMLVMGISAGAARSRWLRPALTLTFLALVGNAIVCGALSNPNHRYQGRIAWLPLGLAMLAGAELLRTRRRETTASAQTIIRLGTPAPEPFAMPVPVTVTKPMTAHRALEPAEG